MESIVVQMTLILGALALSITLLMQLQTCKETPLPPEKKKRGRKPKQTPESAEPDVPQSVWVSIVVGKSAVGNAKLQLERYTLAYTVVWILCFVLIVAGGVYETFDEWSYMKVCVGLALPFLMQPWLLPMPAEEHLPLVQRYSFKANVWIAIFSFVGNYWYTHYFYSVLKAKYTFAAHRLNNVPIALYFATHFYFMTYHTFSNMILRTIEERYVPGIKRLILFWVSVIAFSYFTAYGETLSISSFPCYSFEDRNMAYVVGSAFYGIYFIVSYPVFYSLPVDASLYTTIMESMGTSMLVLILLDLCRLFYGGPPIPLNIGGVGLSISPNTCVY